MNTNRTFDDIMKELLQEKNESIMNEYENMIGKHENIFINSIDEKILKAVMEYEKEEKLKKKKRLFSVLSKVAVFLIACVVAVNYVFPEHVEAFKVKVMDVFFDDEAGAINLKGGGEKSLLEGWTEYYYPEYMLEKYCLTGAEKTGERCVMLFISEDGDHQIKIESIPANSTVSINTDDASVEDVKIGYYKGVYVVDTENENSIITWMNDTNIFNVQGDTSVTKDEYIKIAESLKYVGR